MTYLNSVSAHSRGYGFQLRCLSEETGAEQHPKAGRVYPKESGSLYPNNRADSTQAEKSQQTERCLLQQPI